MKFQIGEYENGDSFDPCDKSKWHQLKEPGIILAQILGIPIAISVLGLIYIYMINYTYVKGIYLNLKDIVIAFIIIIPIHEILHSLAFPNFKQTIFGFIPKGLVSYSFFEGEISRNRLVISLIFPFIILTILPTIGLSFIRIKNNFLYVIIIINAVASYVDILAIFVLLLQVPKSTYIKNIGNRTYWKWNKKY